MKNKHKLNILFFTLIAFLFSCTQSNESSKSGEIRNYKAIVTDSLTFDWLPEVKLLDYNDETGEFLLESQKDILVIDKEANVVSQFNPHVEGPNYVGDNDFGWIFYGENQLMAYGINYFYLFDKNDGLIERYSYPIEVNSWTRLGGFPQMHFHYQEGSKDKMVAFITNPPGPDKSTQAFQDSVKMVYLMDLENGESRPVMHKPETSIYRTIGRYIDRGFPYMTHLQDSKFAQTLASDSILYIWDAESNQLLNQIALPEEFKPDFETTAFGERLEPDRYRTNYFIHSTGRMIVLASNTGIPESVYRDLRKTSRWWESEAYKEAGKKYFSEQYLLFDESRFLGKLKLDIGPYRFDRLSTQSGFMWFQRRYADERDYHTFLKVEIVPEEDKPITN